MKKGFTLLEVILATAIGSFIMLALITFLRQMNENQQKVDHTIDLYTRVARLHHQLERDIMGAFVPTSLPPTNPEQKVTSNEPEKFFWGDSAKGGFLTFITNNPLQSYWSDKTGAAQPAIARVTYRLQPNDTIKVKGKKVKNVFTLMRQESVPFNNKKADEKTKKSPFFALVNGIEKITFTYQVLVDSPAPNKETKHVWYSATEWKDAKDRPKEWPIVPSYITVVVDMWDNLYTRTYSFVFDIEIGPRFDVPKASSANPEQLDTSSMDPKPTSTASTPKLS